ncbi:TonB-dependent receptor [Vibrio coralliilyticus]|uniref:TonB-dependent receptor n=1 Tax=Vibrio coralliilyticus TaxID=190893 RepID=UPI00051277E9|nr:TonB-dependent receptor [Vibrio coralliilyticus]AIU68156.1 TonB-dependent receptor [Vibrio coralliilyticus]
MQSPFTSNLLSTAIRTQLGLAGLVLPIVALSAQAQNFNIPAGDLDSVLNQFALQAGIEYSIDASLSQGQYSLGLQGDYQPDDAFNVLLADAGLSAQKQLDGSYVVDGGDEWSLDAIQVGTSLDGGISRDEAGEANVYDKDAATEYRGKEELERFKGADASDIFKGMANVHSGDARNGGGIDPNIRGIQGPGRVPVIIDGTEQAITVNNGYRGASNRSFLDPNLIGGMTVHKGAQINPDVNTSVGGAVEITTLSPRDIVQPGDTFGMEFIAESSSNSTVPEEPRLYTGQDVSTIPEYANLENPAQDLIYTDPALVINPDKRQDDNPLNGEDTAYRLAVSGIGPKVEWLAAYAYRNRGNYFSGKNDAGFYQQPWNGDESQEIENRRLFIQPEHLALVYHPGEEVPNTSSKMESFLGKFAFNLNYDTKVELGARYTKSVHGEILADRAETRYMSGVAQWPLNETRLQAYNIKLRSKPDNPYIDFKSNLWVTLSDVSSNTGPGSPNSLTGDSTIIKNTARINSEEDRYGLSVSNKMLLGSDVDFTLSGNYQFHELAPKGDLNAVIEEFEQARAGERTEYNGSANIEWRATESLIFNAGVRYGYYKTVDNYVKNRLAAGDTQALSQYGSEGYKLSYQMNVPITDANRAEYLSGIESGIRNADTSLNQEIADLRQAINSVPPFLVPIVQTQLDAKIVEQDALVAQGVADAATHTSYVEDIESEWRHDGQNNYSASDNGCITAANDPNYVAGSCSAQSISASSTSTYTNTESSDSGWMPSASLTWLMTEDSRSYIRYAESLRFPSMFESTVGFSAVPSVSSPLAPERSKLWELGYVYYFDHANIKLTYFDQAIEDVMDRNTSLNTTSFTNLEKLSTSGLELQLDYDDGDYFGDLSVAYNLEYEVCDESAATQRFMADIASTGSAEYKQCRRGGFSNTSYLANKVPPEISGSVHFGARFFNKKLIAGTRTYYASDSHSEDYVKRDHVTTVDAYIGYAYNEHLQFEVRGSNLTDMYYLEPGAVTGIPAPGRTISVKLTSRF